MKNELETTKELASAAKEVATTTGKAIDAAGSFGEFLDRVFGDVIVDSVGLFSDRLKHYRLKKALLLAEKTQEVLDARSIVHTRAVPPKIAIPLFENATLEEDEDLQDIWANLLATAMDPKSSQISKYFVTILSNMTQDDARILNRIRRTISRRFKEERSWDVTYGEVRAVFAHALDSPVDGRCVRTERAMINLISFGLVKPAFLDNPVKRLDGVADTDLERGNVGGFYPIPVDLRVVSLSPVGNSFCSAVMPDAD